MCQYAISIFLVVSTAVMFNQLRMMADHDLGYDQEEILLLELHGPRKAQLAPILKERLLQLDTVLGVTITGYAFTRGWNGSSYRTPSGSVVGVTNYRVDEDFIDTMGMRLIAGRNFSEDHPSDPTEALIVNETMARAFGWDPMDAAGQLFQGWRGAGMSSTPAIVGVVRDFHNRSLKDALEPVALHMGRSVPFAMP